MSGRKFDTYLLYPSDDVYGSFHLPTKGPLDFVSLSTSRCRYLRDGYPCGRLGDNLRVKACEDKGCWGNHKVNSVSEQRESDFRWCGKGR
jgi:hypothetical protein